MDKIAQVQREVIEAPDDEHALGVIRRAVTEGLCTLEELRAALEQLGAPTGLPAR